MHSRPSCLSLNSNSTTSLSPKTSKKPLGYLPESPTTTYPPLLFSSSVLSKRYFVQRLICHWQILLAKPTVRMRQRTDMIS
ncbi:hypothetical protein RHGRI_016841 [Rhododendron griersonianum]|uniref:Uncharacterized protein n=1 Tax=Rhododendron griersonianum TaxID=479676 RepID=A0AAV6JVJ2_9ERIC|nr:hypothetical protein RHGRI_016841 [Rhododendron griersonianum]